MQARPAFQVLFPAIEAAFAAGSVIMEVYRQKSFRITLKRDLSPVTIADKQAHSIITDILEPTGIPVLSEEGRNIPYGERKNWEQFWLVDPLDGTKEFIQRNDEFTVNIALIQGTEPVAGVIFAPVTATLYFGMVPHGAGIRKGSVPASMEEVIKQAQPLPCPVEERPYRLIASRSHLNRATRAFISDHLANYPQHQIVNRGSSLKLCMIAEGSADTYPRFGPTMEWDTAAGDAIIRAAGGRIVIADTFLPLQYNKPDLHNPWFVATSYQMAVRQTG